MAAEGDERGGADVDGVGAESDGLDDIGAVAEAAGGDEGGAVADALLAEAAIDGGDGELDRSPSGPRAP